MPKHQQTYQSSLGASRPRKKVAVRAGITDQCVVRLLALLLLPRGKGVADSKVSEFDIIFIV